MLARIVVFAALLAAFAAGQIGVPGGRLTQSQLQAQQLLKSLVQSHPEPLVSKQLNQWIISGRVDISYQSDYMPPSMAGELAQVGGKWVPVLLVNPDFMINSTSFSFVEDQKYKQLVIFHEATHLADHFSGRIPFIRGDTFTVADIPRRAPHIWRSEWSGVSAEWQLAKKMHIEHLVPKIREAVAKYGEKLGFLEGFYQMIIVGAEVRPREAFVPYWRKIYLQERAKVAAARK